MEYIKEEKDINLKELFLDVISKWRSMMILGIIAMCIVLIINVPGLIKYKDILGIAVVIKALVKYLVVAFLGTFLLTFTFYSFKYMFSDIIKSPRDYCLSSNLKLLGIIPCLNDRRNSFIDQMIKKSKGIKISHLYRENLIERIVNVIVAEMQVRDKKEGKIAVVSSCDEDSSMELLELLNEKISDKTVEMVFVGDIQVNENAVKAVMETDFVILAERQYKSKYSEFEQTCKQLVSWNKEILGTVLLDVDAL